MSQEEQLWRRLQNGDPEALRRIYETYKNDLLATATMMLIDASAAEDCLHDVFVTLASEAHRLEIRRSLKGYLSTCVVNRARDRLRRKERLNVSLSDPSVATAAAAGTAVAGETGRRRYDPAASILQAEQTAMIMAALAELPPEQREIIVLHVRADLTFRQIAEMKQISINTVQSRYRYGMERLRRLLNDQGAET